MLRISSGTVDVSGQIDPFTDIFNPAQRVAIENNGNFNIIQGAKQVAYITGTGTTTVSAAPLVPISLVTDFVRNGTLSIQSSATQLASVTIRPNGGPSGTSRVNVLAISGPPAAPTARLDLNDNDLVIDYTGPTPFNNVYNWIRAGYAGGAWTGNGITSSRAATSPNPPEAGRTALGYAEATSIFTVFPAVFSGQIIDNTSMLVKYTYYGDANLDGQVDITDLGILATNWQTPGYWAKADFDYSGFIDITDLGLLATNWQAGVGSPLGPSLDEALASLGLPSVSVPEPGAAMLLLSALSIAGRIRRVRR